MVLSTVSVNLPWHRYVAALAPKGRLVHVGMLTEPIGVSGAQLIAGQKAVSVYIDNSFSMNAQTDDGELLYLAKQKAVQIATFSKLIEPSENTENQIFEQADKMQDLVDLNQWRRLYFVLK